jgi:hypothetical protein
MSWINTLTVSNTIVPSQLRKQRRNLAVEHRTSFEVRAQAFRETRRPRYRGLAKDRRLGFLHRYHMLREIAPEADNRHFGIDLRH